MGIEDIPPEILNEMNQGLLKKEPRFETFHERIGSSQNRIPPQTNLIPTLIKQGWLDQSSKDLGSDSLTNNVALLMFENSDQSSWTVPRFS